MKVAFFPGCMVDMFYPEIGIAAVNVLERLGCEVEMPEEQVCCGQGLLNSGYAKETIPVAKNILDAYDLDQYETIVSLTGSCMNAIINDYPTVLEDVEYLHKLERIRPRMFEFTDFIVNQLHTTDVGASFHHKVTYHKSCHVTRFLGIEEQPLQLLKAVEGLEYIEMVHAERCCGFGGTFSFKEPGDFGGDRQGEVRDHYRDGRRCRMRCRRALPHEHQGRACALAHARSARS